MSLLHLVWVRGSDCLGKGEVDSMLFFVRIEGSPGGAISGMKISILSQAEKCQVIFNVDLPSANDDLADTHSQMPHVP